MKPLYEITADLKEIVAQIESGEIPPDAAVDILDQMTGALEEKIQNVALHYKNLLAERGMIKVEEDKLAARRKSLTNEIDFYKDYLLNNMEENHLDKVSTPNVVVTIRNNKASVVCDLDKLDKQYIHEKVSVSADKNAIYAAITSGFDVIGAQLKPSKSVVIK